MILYTNTDDKVICYKCKQPKMKNFDHFWTNINGECLPFYFSVRNNASYYYFIFNNHWYMTNIVQESGLDLFHYLHEKDLALYQEKITK